MTILVIIPSQSTFALQLTKHSEIVFRSHSTFKNSLPNTQLLFLTASSEVLLLTAQQSQTKPNNAMLSILFSLFIFLFLGLFGFYQLLVGLGFAN
ncbi:hypothetical protein RchiOBHm_Chr5g0057031 [Rosa chinensis]|uniref:Uncharacterized protein n=1 Tax=Rosa chinensis TaxID=74649 RepID=A0A2P6QGT2_ROSCH|nr:hypothetical protein RchiOBHm_Chr5g0057031 [Rosa chinensis]